MSGKHKFCSGEKRMIVNSYEYFKSQKEQGLFKGIRTRQLVSDCLGFCKKVGPTCKQCEAKIDPLLLNPQRSTTDARARCVGCGKLQYGYAFRTISGRVIVRRCIACENDPKAVEFWEEKLESLASIKKAMGPDWYPKKEKKRSRLRKLTARNVKYIEQKKQQKRK
ncbi:hypothetical protein PInf_029027 [Phytophthora infestans]|nr:hypothetical protein PInf_029027 [Phytophthora infestans]